MKQANFFGFRLHQPQPAFGIFLDGKNVVETQAVFLFGVVPERVSVEAVETVGRADPYEAPAVLTDGICLPVRQPLLHAVVFYFGDVLLCRERQREPKSQKHRQGVFSAKKLDERAGQNQCFSS